MNATDNAQIVHLKFSYPKMGQAHDALLSRAVSDAEARFIEPSKFTFYAVLDTYPDKDHEPEPGMVDVVVMATLTPVKVPWYKRLRTARKESMLHL